MTALLVCTRCKNTTPIVGLQAPSNCPVCNYPDAPPPGWQPTEPVVDLEAEVGPEAALGTPDGRPPPQPSHVPNRPGTTAFHTGWLAEVLRDTFHAHKGNEIDWLDIAGQVVERYNGERPTLLCGCLAGVHGRSLQDIAAAHPERAAE